MERQVAGRVARIHERAARKKAGACVSCGLCICPGARGKDCVARKATAEEWEQIQKTKWV